MLEKLYYLYVFKHAPSQEYVDFALSSEFNKTFLAALRNSVDILEKDYGAINLTLDYDFSITIYTVSRERKLVITYTNLSSGIIPADPKQKLWNLIEESFGDYSATIYYGGKYVQ